MGFLGGFNGGGFSGGTAANVQFGRCVSLSPKTSRGGTRQWHMIVCHHLVVPGRPLLSRAIHRPPCHTPNLVGDSHRHLETHGGCL